MSGDGVSAEIDRSDFDHVLKVVAPYFDALADGSKAFEVRRNDRGFQKGDRLLLWDYDPAPGAWRTFMPGYHRVISATVSFVYAGDPRFSYGNQHALNPGWVVLGLSNLRWESGERDTSPVTTERP